MFLDLLASHSKHDLVTIVYEKWYFDFSLVVRVVCETIKNTISSE